VARVCDAAGQPLLAPSAAAAADSAPLIAQALLALPEIPVQSVSGQKPPVVWVNVGLLAEDGMVLQLKLRRGEKQVSERDRLSGVWYAYQPVGGALTLLRHAPAAAAATTTAAAPRAVLAATATSAANCVPAAPSVQTTQAAVTPSAVRAASNSQLLL
jgi:hypothetical protein